MGLQTRSNSQISQISSFHHLDASPMFRPRRTAVDHLIDACQDEPKFKEVKPIRPNAASNLVMQQWTDTTAWHHKSSAQMKAETENRADVCERVGRSAFEPAVADPRNYKAPQSDTSLGISFGESQSWASTHKLETPGYSNAKRRLQPSH